MKKQLVFLLIFDWGNNETTRQWLLFAQQKICVTHSLTVTGLIEIIRMTSHDRWTGLTGPTDKNVFIIFHKINRKLWGRVGAAIVFLLSDGFTWKSWQISTVIVACVERSSGLGDVRCGEMKAAGTTPLHQHFYHPAFSLYLEYNNLELHWAQDLTLNSGDPGSPTLSEVCGSRGQVFIS